MLSPKFFIDTLASHGIDFYAGVPDSLLKNLCAYLMASLESEKHFITANEGGAIAMAVGHHLSTGKTGVVYMQNSGLGNAINPLLSIADKEVYSIPMLLLIGWRGEPGTKDEPQHVKQGKVTLSLLEAMDIPACVLPDNPEDAVKTLASVIKNININNMPHAILIRKNTFEDYKYSLASPYQMTREEALKEILKNIDTDSLIVSTTGKTSREIFEIREQLNLPYSKDFLNIGGMGHTSQIALAIALQKTDKMVYCLDGDGAALMHMGAMAINGTAGAKNFCQIIINNGAHESVGGQPTCAFKIDFPAVAQACGYKKTFRTDKLADIPQIISETKNSEGPFLIEIMTKCGSRKDLGRPTTSPINRKIDFMDNLS